VLTEYDRPDFKPVFMVESNYEFEHIPNTDGGSPQNLRRQEYWTMLSGAIGQVYGSAHTWRLEKGWETKLDTLGVMELSYMKNLFAPRRWYDLIPDRSHTVMTAGYNRAAEYIGRLSAYLGNRGRLLTTLKKMTNLASVSGSTYAAAARTSDGSLVIVYMPSPRTVTVDMSKLSGLASAR
jgi:hypothetical protein